MTMNKTFSNAVFTLLPPDEVPDPLFDNSPDQEEEDDDYNSYKKAVEGSYDKSYFVDETTGGFRFPKYNKDWQGLVLIRDLTPYKNQYFDYLGPEQRKAFTIDDFESQFHYPVFDVQDFPDYLENLPDACFNKGISRAAVLRLFDDFEDFIRGEADADDCLETGMENSPALQAGLVELVDKSAMTPEKLWEDYASQNEVEQLCKANGIQPMKRNSANIKKLLEKNIPFPREFVRPTQLLKDCYTSFIDLYVEEIKRSTNHFHPLLFKDLWEEVKRECNNDEVEKKVKKILAAPYWKDRLISVGKPEDEEDDLDFDEDDEDEEDDDE
jgi:hypothetical protein